MDAGGGTSGSRRRRRASRGTGPPRPSSARPAHGLPRLWRPDALLRGGRSPPLPRDQRRRRTPRPEPVASGRRPSVPGPGAPLHPTGSAWPDRPGPVDPPPPSGPWYRPDRRDGAPRRDARADGDRAPSRGRRRRLETLWKVKGRRRRRRRTRRRRRKGWRRPTGPRQGRKRCPSRYAT